MLFSIFRPMTRARWAPRKISPVVFLSNRRLLHSTPILKNNSSRKWKESYVHLNAEGSPISAAHIETQDLLIVDRVLEPQTIMGFLGFLFGATLPNGTRPPSLATLGVEELALIQGSDPVLGTDTQSVMYRVMGYIGSHEDGSRLCGVGKNIQSLKSRLWSGITPLSDQRWKEKGLDLPENFDQACQNLGAVVAVFEYLNVPQVRDNLRDTFNLIYDAWTELDTVLNQHRADAGKEAISVANLWTLYMTVHLEAISQRAHKWVTTHVDILQVPLMQEYLTYQSPIEESGAPDSEHLRLADALHILLETSIRADHTIMVPMEGYKGYVVPEKGSGPPDIYIADHASRGAAYAQCVKTLSHIMIFDRIIQETIEHGEPQKKLLGKSWHENTTDQLEAQKQVRRELCGDSIDATIEEPWITSNLNIVKNHIEVTGSPKELGLAIYRLNYGQSESEWLEFVKRVEEHIFDWGAGQAGSDAIKPYLKLHWVDGLELGFAENDFEAAKRHFNEVLQTDSIDEQGVSSLLLQDKAFLAIDSTSFNSYMNNSYDSTQSAVLKGDSAGFVLAIDPSFDPNIGVNRAEESPGYTGQMRVLGSLVWGDLYAILESQSAQLPELWPLAMHHPDQVYVGPVIPLQRYHWQAQKEGKWNVVSDAMHHLKDILK